MKHRKSLCSTSCWGCDALHVRNDLPALNVSFMVSATFLVALSSCVLQVDALVVASNVTSGDDQYEAIQLELLPPPPVYPSGTASRQWLKIVTGGDLASVSAAEHVVRNQRDYAERHGYAYEVHTGNYAHPWIGYWHKIDVLLREMQVEQSPQVLVWLDLDVVMTQPSSDMFEHILAKYPSHKLILTEDAQRGDDIPDSDDAKRLVNTGIMLVRNSLDAQRVLENLLNYGRQHRNAAYMPQDTNTLHEQDGFNFLLSGPRKHVWRRHIAAIPQRTGELNLNTFARNLYDEQFKDPVASEWKTGDFTAHCTGLRKQLREWCISDSIEASEAAADASDAAFNSTHHESGDEASVLDGGSQVSQSLGAQVEGSDLSNNQTVVWMIDYSTQFI